MTDDLGMPLATPGDGAHAPDDAPGQVPDDATATDPRANPFDAWLDEAPAAPDSGLCPWCSTRLDPPTLETCPSCGAHLRGDEPGEIPGLTVVDPEVTVRRVPAAKPSAGTGVLAWLSGETDLVRAATEGQPQALARPSPPGAAGVPPAPADPASVLGPPSPDAVRPPDPRLRREMRRLASGAPSDDEAGVPGDASTAADDGSDPAPDDVEAATGGDGPGVPPVAG